MYALFMTGEAGDSAFGDITGGLAKDSSGIGEAETDLQIQERMSRAIDRLDWNS